MKLASFIDGSRASYGLAEGNYIVDLGRVLGDRHPTLRDLIAHVDFRELVADAASSANSLNIASVQFAPVIPNPDKIVCVGMNYRDHVAEIGRTVTERPALFARFSDSQVGHLQPIIRPKVSEEYDYEGELAVVIGKSGRHVAERDALSYVAGYSCYNEGSVRDWQRHTGQFLSGKSFSKSGSFGPWMVTADELADPGKLTLQTRLNGQVVQQTSTANLITSVPALIAYCSTIFNLLPGDVIVTGTPGGVGFKRSPPLFMKPGDTVEVEISGVGTLRNGVAAEA
jgi:2-keto-4-pentenoate hydratase/2-oxohepta-3-ene-1,7-dioic acid hydratase in catechol pathway